MGDGEVIAKQQTFRANLKETTLRCKKDVPSIVHGTVGYAGDINKTISFLKQQLHKNMSCGIKHLFIWDSEGVVPPGIPSVVDLDIIPHPRNIVPKILDGYRFAQIKFVALLLETAKRMDGNENLTHLILSDSDETINFSVLKPLLQRYMPDGLLLGGDLVDQVIEGGYINGPHFYTRDLVFAIRAYLEAYVGSFPNVFYLNNPHSNVDVAMSSLVRSVGGTLVAIPGVHSLSAYCSLPLGYLKWPLVANPRTRG